MYTSTGLNNCLILSTRYCWPDRPSLLVAHPFFGLPTPPLASQRCDRGSTTDQRPRGDGKRSPNHRLRGGGAPRGPPSRGPSHSAPAGHARDARPVTPLRLSRQRSGFSARTRLALLAPIAPRRLGVRGGWGGAWWPTQHGRNTSWQLTQKPWKGGRASTQPRGWCACVARLGKRLVRKRGVGRGRRGGRVSLVLVLEPLRAVTPWPVPLRPPPSRPLHQRPCLCRRGTTPPIAFTGVPV